MEDLCKGQMRGSRFEERILFTDSDPASGHVFFFSLSNSRISVTPEWLFPEGNRVFVLDKLNKNINLMLLKGTANEFR